MKPGLFMAHAHSLIGCEGRIFRPIWQIIYIYIHIIYFYFLCSLFTTERCDLQFIGERLTDLQVKDLLIILFSDSKVKDVIWCHATTDVDKPIGLLYER